MMHTAAANASLFPAAAPSFEGQLGRICETQTTLVCFIREEVTM